MPRCALVALLLAGCTSSLVPPPDRCTPDGNGAVDSWVIGPSTNQPFHAWMDGDTANFIVDESGRAFMFRIDAAGAPAPACFTQTTTVTIAGQAKQDSTARASYAQPDGSRMTRDIYLPVDGCCSPSSVDVTVTLAGQTITRHLAP